MRASKAPARDSIGDVETAINTKNDSASAPPGPRRSTANAGPIESPEQGDRTERRPADRFSRRAERSRIWPVPSTHDYQVNLPLVRFARYDIGRLAYGHDALPIERGRPDLTDVIADRLLN